MAEAASIPQAKQEGIVYVSSYGGIYSKTKTDAKKLKQFSRNVYGKGISTKHGNLIFQEKYTIEVFDPVGNPDPELAKTITSMFDSRDVRLWPMMKLAWNDVFWFGMAFFNPVWEWKEIPVALPGGRYELRQMYVLKKLRRLPPETFGTAAYDRPSLYSEILKGVTLNPETGDIEYWQTIESLTDVVPNRDNYKSFSGKLLQKALENIFTVSDPSNGEIAGQPIILPVAPVLGMLNFTWQAQMQKVNRVGAPLMFIELTDPTEDDITYAQTFLANWGKNTGHKLRPNMRIIVPDLKESGSAAETINLLSRLIVDFFTPASLIAKDGTLIGGSSASEQELLLSYIRSNHSWIQESFEILLQTFLEANGFRGYSAKINIPSPSIDKSEIWIKQALALGRLTQAGLTVASENEFRNLLEQTELDEKTIEAMIQRREVYRVKETHIPQDLAALMKARLAVDIKREEFDPGEIMSDLQYRRTVQTALDIFDEQQAALATAGDNAS